MKKIILSLMLVMLFVGCQNQTEKKQMDWGTKEAFDKSQKAMEETISKVETKTENVNTKPMPANPLIKYEVLRSWTPGKSGIGMDVLVSPTSTKNEAMSLAKYFVNRYRSEGLTVIFIFDLKEAWANRDNDNYSQKKYFHHFLVSIMGDKIMWAKE